MLKKIGLMIEVGLIEGLMSFEESKSLGLKVLIESKGTLRVKRYYEESLGSLLESSRRSICDR